ncbi:RNA-binding S4 domain-containing protein [Sphingomonas sp. PL-96]|jgi:ribosome-associated heat shock protein Hsp15|uniref:RNA-binding S4 domain-containing protein n=1 Tax=Sphingomonas sp. PL-96 TaxID=2887201 RepID=UPI001E405AFF|nr:S4 domain-containing protein [Sphingomonas sp. PL-96]MCC2977521.1 RNA-binding S4 domain-containing protein [Sphingomonas sp. PL-96]
MRLDRFLWFARLVKTRSAAQSLAEGGLLRIDGRRIDRAHCPVRPGVVVAFPRNGRVLVLRVLALPRRRGPAAEAAESYQLLEPAPAVPVDEAGLPA